MARRRPSSGSYGIAIDSNPRVGPPPSAPRNSNSRNRLIPQSDASSVERWLTSPTIPTDRKHSSRSSSQKKKLQDAQTKSAIPLIHSHKPAQRVTRGQRLLHERIATTCSDSFAATKQPNPPKRQQRKLEESQQVSRIFKQRQGKRFTFEEECDQQVPAVETDDSLNPSEEDDQHQILNRSRPGMTSPGVDHHRNYQSTHVPLPPAPSHPARPHRPTHATPVAVSIPPTHKNTQNTTSRKTKTIIPFVKRHTLAVGKNDGEFGSDETTQEPAQRRCSTSPGSQGIRPKLQQSLFQDDSISVSSSVTRPIDPVSNSLDRHLVPNHQRANSNLSHGTSKSDSLSSGTEANRSTVSNNNLARKTVQSRQFRFPSMRDLVSLGSEGISHSESKRTISLNYKSSGSSKTKSSGGKPFDFKKTAKAGSPNSCSITAATSGTVMSTPTNDSQDEEISQLTFPESHATQQTNGIHSNAETEKVQNISRRGDGMRSIKVHPNAAPKRLSLHIRQQSDEEREKEDVDSRGSSKNTTSPDNPTETLNATETVSAMTELLRKTNRIKLHVYDLVENDTQLDLFGCYFPLGQCFNALNSSLHSMGTGAYHVGIEINGVEYAYGANSTTGLTGVFTCMPKHSPGYQYRQTIDFGNRLTTRNQYSGEGSHRKVATPVPVDGREIVREMASEYMGVDYDLLRKNCCTFAHDACTRLGVRENEIPTWFHNLAAVGAVTQDAAQSTLAPINHAFNCDLHKLSGIVHETRLEDDKKGTNA